MNIYLIRHGQVEFSKEKKRQGSAGLELSETGQRQAEILGGRLMKCNIDRIYTSDLKRTVQTADIMNKYIGTTIIVTSDLREINMGDWDTKSMDEIMQQYKDFYAEWCRHRIDLPYPNGECGEDVRKRSMKIIKEIVMQGLENVAVVTHGGVIRTLMSSFMGLSLEKRFNFEVNNCSISLLKYEPQEEKFKVQYINDYYHLEELEMENSYFNL